MSSTNGILSFKARLFIAVLLCALSGVAVYSAPFNPPSQVPINLETRYIVKFKDTAGMSSLQSSTLQANRQANVLSTRGATVRTRLRKHNAITITIDPALVSQLRMDPSIEYVELDQPRHFLAQSAPWGVAAVQADLISDAAASNTTVCIIDSGYDINSPDLTGNNHFGTNIGGTGNWFVPGGSHGTHVAGTIAAFNNSEGVVGVLPNGNINIHVVKVFNEDGWGYVSDLVDAIGVCVDAGADVVNMSLGGATSSTMERSALLTMFNEGLLLIAAAGNDGTTAHSFPASYDSVISVAAVDENLQRAAFSQATTQVELSGPGVAVLSTVGVGDGVQSTISLNGTQFGDDRVVPHNRYVPVGSGFVNQYTVGNVSGVLASCTVSATGNYSCGNMSGRICLAQRFANETASSYPEINPLTACANAGAIGAIVYSNSALPGLQNPFLVDENTNVDFPSVSVSRQLGLTLVASVGQTVTVQTTGNTDYAYYNGTSMAAPHVTGVAALVWSHHRDCSNGEIRQALVESALDIDTNGRDNRTGFGIVQAEAAMAYLDTNGCDGVVENPAEDEATILQNGVVASGLSAQQGDSLLFALAVPAGAQNLSFTINGGTGDADLYVRFGQAPTVNNFDCRPYLSGNNETCNISNIQVGTYFVELLAFSNFSGVSLVGSYTVPGSGGVASIFENDQNYNIPDNDTTGVSSPINSNHDGVAGIVSVQVAIVHSYIGDLIVDLIHPNGSVVNLHNRTGGSNDNLNQIYSVDFGNLAASGTWNLRVQDRARLDAGFIDWWRLSFQ